MLRYPKALLPRRLQADVLVEGSARTQDPLKKVFLQDFPYFDGSNEPLEQQRTSHISCHLTGPTMKKDFVKVDNLAFRP